MTIDPFWAGVLSVIFLEMTVIIISGIYKAFKK